MTIKPNNMSKIFKTTWGVLLALVLTACAETPQQASSTLSDDWSAMMVVHDEVMPKMSNIARLKKQLKGDSTALPIVLKLTKAEDAMWEWMHGLRQESELKEMPEPEAKAYLAKETQHIEEVKAMMLNSMAEAETYLDSKETR